MSNLKKVIIKINKKKKAEIEFQEKFGKTLSDCQSFAFAEGFYFGINETNHPSAVKWHKENGGGSWDIFEKAFDIGMEATK